MLSPVTRVPQRPAAAPSPRGAGLTHKGPVRPRNEDSILTDPGGTLWAISDGMGGHGHGDVASDIVIQCLAEITDGDAEAEPAAHLRAQLERANRLVRERARTLGGGTMGATAVALIVTRAVAHVAWVGDSRAYLFRRGQLRPLTRDHTVVQDLLDEGEISEEDAALHPESHVVTRAIGGTDDLELDQVAVPLQPDDWLLLCSDGLSGWVYDQQIAGALAGAGAPEEACRRLLLEAFDAGTTDNVSVIAVHLQAA